MFYNRILLPILDSIHKYPQNNAFCINNIFYTYAEFGEYVSKVRNLVQHVDLRNNSIGLAANNDIETYASIIALWLDGYNYVPLHPHWPLERCSSIIEQVGIELVLDSSQNSRYTDVRVINTVVGNTDPSCNLTPKKLVGDNNLAYILFTSGSTGVPKGVPILRKNLAAFTKSFWDIGFEISSDDRCLQCFDLTFDLSVTSYLMPLLVGACCYTVPDTSIKYLYIYQLMDEHQLTFTLMAPSTIRYLQPYFSEINCPAVRYSLFCGEALNTDITDGWSKCLPNADIYNVYGPTEDTIYCTYYKYNRDGGNKDYNGVLSIGKTMTSGEVLVLDEQGNVCKPNEKGELCLWGDQLFDQYWKNDEKTRTSFITLADGRRFYKSGDLCFTDEDGDIMYSGRLDHQAKIQGFRVEMGEIEHHARVFLNGTNVVCLAYDNEKGLTEIAMFIESEQFDTTELVANMRTKMPPYMIPSKTFFVPKFALNINGKIDKNILKALIK